MNNNVRSVRVESATSIYLIEGMVVLLGVMLMEIFAIYHCINDKTFKSAAMLFAIQLPMFFVGQFPIVYLSAYFRRKEFTLHFAAIENVNVAELEKKYFICHICNNNVIFTDKENKPLYRDWEWMNNIIDEEVDEILSVEAEM